MFSLERDDDTICAVATAPGVGGISVIRLSGDYSESVIRKCCAFLPDELESHRVFYGYFKSPKDCQDVDEVLVTYFQEGRSFTSEFTFEISCHGGSLISQVILESLIHAGARMAEPGEFTYRAFMNGRIDLVQAEGVLQLIESQSKKASQLSLRQLKGVVSDKLLQVESQTTHVLAHLEANIDFASEDIEVASSSNLAKQLQVVIDSVDDLLSSYKDGRILQEGLRIALVGCPNVGKSSLLNCLSGEEKAIVTDVPGTTRDFVESRIMINGLPVQFIDTAGLRNTDDQVEKIGIDRTKEVIKSVDFVFLLVDVSAPELPEGVEQMIESSENPWIIVGNKVDLAKKTPILEQKRGVFQCFSEVFRPKIEGFSFFPASTLGADGISEVLNFLDNETRKEFSENSATISQARHFELLKKVKQRITSACELLQKEESPDMVALELQEGLVAVFEILGKRFDDEVMDQVFREFCLGK